MGRRLEQLKKDAAASKKKATRDKKVRDGVPTIRTYDKKRNLVTDHRTGKTASWKDIMVKGKLDKLR